MKVFHSFRAPLILGAALCLSCVSSAHADATYSSQTQVNEDSAGNYQRKATEEATDAAGTTHSTTSKDSVEVGTNGDSEVRKSTKKVTDPPGLFNKSTAETSETTTTKANGNLDSQTVSKSENANGTADETVDKKTVRVNSKGHRKTKIVHRKTHQPGVGLMNKTTQETTDTSEQKDNGQVETTHETTVNGRTTEKSDKLQ